MAIGSLISKGIGKLVKGALGSSKDNSDFTGVNSQTIDAITGAGSQISAARGTSASIPTEAPWHLAKDIMRVSLSSELLFTETETEYLKELKLTNGLVFPYTPTIMYSYNSDWATYDLTHTNYQPKTFTKSEISDITITATFTAQTRKEARYCLETIHFLRAMAKMRYGVKDAKAGAPPPVMTLNAYGTIFDNIPVIMKSFNHELMNNADYIMVDYESSDGVFETASIPTMFNVTIVLAHQPNLSSVSNNFQWNEFLQKGQTGYL